jgi:hypothetical protein
MASDKPARGYCKSYRAFSCAEWFMFIWGSVALLINAFHLFILATSTQLLSSCEDFKTHEQNTESNYILQTYTRYNNEIGTHRPTARTHVIVLIFSNIITFEGGYFLHGWSVKAQTGVEVWLYLVFNLGARRGWVVNAIPRPFTPRKKTQYPIV